MSTRKQKIGWEISRMQRFLKKIELTEGFHQRLFLFLRKEAFHLHPGTLQVEIETMSVLKKALRGHLFRKLQI